MSTHTAMLIQSLKHKAGLFKVSIVLVATLALSGCFGLDCQITNSSTGETTYCPKISTGDSTPVIYNLPVNEGDYDLSALQFSVTFPNGLAAKSATQIKLNGVDITNDFNDWGVGVTNTARVTLAINGTNTPIINAAIRDGRNSFQVTQPMKNPVFFTVDIPGAAVHFTNIDDGWTGETFRIQRDGGGNVVVTERNGTNVANRIYTAKRGYLDATGYIDGEGYSNISQMCVHTYTVNSSGVQSALNSSKGAAFTNAGYTMCNTSALGSTTNPGGYYLDFGQANFTPIGLFETPVVGAGNFTYYTASIGDGWTATNIVLIGSGTAPWGSPVIPQGAQIAGIQGTNTMTRTINVSSGGDEYRINLSAAQRNGNATFQRVGVYVGGVFKGNIQPAAGGAFQALTVSLGTLAAGNHNLELRGLNPNGGDNTAFVDNIQLWNANANPNYNFSFRVRDTGNNNTNYNENEVDVIQVTVTDDFGTHQTSWLRSNVPLWDSRLANKGGISLSFDQIAMLSTGLGAADLINGMVISAPGNSSDDIDIGVGNGVTELYFGNDNTIDISVPAGQNNANQGRLYVDANLETRVYVDVGIWAICEEVYTNTENAFIRFRANVDIAIDKSARPYITNTALNNVNLDLGAIQGGGLCGPIINGFQGTIQDAVVGIIQNTVGGIMANDIPTMRAKIFIEVPDVGVSRDFGPYYLPIQPEISAIYGLPKGGAGADPNTVKWGILLGMHARGSNAISNPDPGQRNMSMGIKWFGVPAATTPALLADNAADERTLALGTTLGATITEDFINALLMGLWESGLVYFDFGFSMPPVYAGNAALDNLRFTFATQQPWEINLFPDGTPNGDAQLYFPDLVVEVLGDAVYPVPKTDYNIATMLANVNFNINLDASDDGKSLQISVADTVEVEVKEVSSDWDTTTEAQLIYIFDQVFTLLSADFSIDVPFPEILSSTVDIKSVKTNAAATAIQVPIDIYNPDFYPKGPDGGIFQVTSVTAIGSGVTIPNGWRNLFNNIDDNNSPGLVPFHVYMNRDYTRDCIDQPGYVELGCQEYGSYYWTESFEWGFRVQLNGTYDMNGITLNRRNDCCNTRADDITIRFYEGTTLRHTSAPTNGSGTGTMYIDIPDGTNVSRIDFVVVADGGESDTYPNSRYDTSQGNPGSADHVINITEIDFDFTPQ